MKFLKKSFLFVITAILSSCSMEQDVDELQNYGSYISLPETTDFTNLTTKEIDVLYGLVEPRIDLYVTADGLYAMKAKSGSEINVSENIYCYFKQITQRTNDYMLKHRSLKRNKLISRSEADAGAMYDCVAYAVWGARRVDSVETAKKRIGYNVANGGIPTGDMKSVLEIFGRVEELTHKNFRRSERFNKPVIIVTRPDPTTNIGHAINALEQDGGYLYCFDHQLGCRDTVSLGEVYFYYMYMD